MAEFSSMEAGALRETWQGRALAATRHRALGLVVLSVIAHSHDDVEVLLRAVFPDFQGLQPPGLTSAGKVAKTGAVVADIITKTGARILNQPLFLNERHMEGAFRHLADDLKLADADRIAMFDTLKRWVVADHRLDPTMDPCDPEAKRLVLH